MSFYFPPAGGGGVQRPLKLAQYLPTMGIETHVLAPDDPRWMHRDDARPSTQAWVHRVRYVGPGGGKPAERLRGKQGLSRAAVHAQLMGRRLLVPDENVTWNVTAIPAAIRLVREHGIDAVITTSPPPSVHLIGAAVKRATGVQVGRRPPRLARRPRPSAVGQRRHAGQAPPARAGGTRRRAAGRRDHLRRRLHRRRDAPARAARPPRDDPERLRLRRRRRPRPHPAATGCGSPTPGASSGSATRGRSSRRCAASELDVVASFLGDFRAADREWAEGLGLGDRLELVPHVPRAEALALQRASDALLLLIPDAGGRGKGILSGKVFEYIAVGRPILAAVPPDGAAARLIEDTGTGVIAAPDDVDGIRAALEGLHGRYLADDLPDVVLADEWRQRLSRQARVEEMAAVLEAIA